MSAAPSSRHDARPTGGRVMTTIYGIGSLGLVAAILWAPPDRAALAAVFGGAVASAIGQARGQRRGSA